VIGKRLRKFEYRPEVCGATNGSTWMGYGIYFYNDVSLFFMSTIF
jgi:hypothetical protein